MQFCSLNQAVNGLKQEKKHDYNDYNYHNLRKGLTVQISYCYFSFERVTPC